MDRRVIGGSINSISRFIHLAACQTVKTAPILKYFRNMVAVLKLLKPILDEIIDSQISSDEKLLKLSEELDLFVNEAREILEKHSQRISRICNVLQCSPLVMKVQRSSMEICCLLRNLLQSSPLTSLSTCIQHCIQELENAEQDQTLKLIEDALRDQRDYVISCPEHIMKIAEALGLQSNQELLMESISLEKERVKAELKRKKGDVELINQVIELVMQINNCMAKLEHLRMINGLAIPSYFRCPLSLELMSDPVIVASGQTYERTFIQKWLDHGLRICPKTHQTLAHTNLIPNYTVKALITNWCEDNGIRLCHSVELNNISSPCLSHLASEDLSRANSFRGSFNRDSTSRSSHEVGNGFEQQITDASSQSGEEESCLLSHNQTVSDKAPFKCHPFLEQQPYSHSWSESVSSAISTVDVLSRSDDRIVTLPACSPSHADLGFSPLFSGTQLQCSKNGNNNDLKSNSSFAGSGSDDLTTSSHVGKLVDDLQSRCDEVQREAALELRLLAKHNTENRILITKCGAITPLLSLLYSRVKVTQENAVTALLNLSINDNNKTAIAEAGAIEPLIHVLKCGNTVAKENSAAALFSLSVLEEYKIIIGRSGAVKALVDLLGSGTLRGKKDAATALFNLSISHENKARIVQAGAVKYLVELMDPDSGMVDKAVALLANLSTIPEGCSSITQEGGIPLLVEVVETGSQRGKENAASALLQLCTNSHKFCSLVLQEGAVPPLIALSQMGTLRAKEKAQQILSHFRSQREGTLRKGGS